MHRGLFGTWLPRHSSGILQIAADALQSRIQRDRDPLGQGLHLHLRLYGTSHSTTFCHSRLPPGYTRSLKIRHLESQGICLGIASGNYTLYLNVHNGFWDLVYVRNFAPKSVFGKFWRPNFPNADFSAKFQTCTKSQNPALGKPGHLCVLGLLQVTNRQFLRFYEMFSWWLEFCFESLKM